MGNSFLKAGVKKKKRKTGKSAFNIGCFRASEDLEKERHKPDCKQERLRSGMGEENTSVRK